MKDLAYASHFLKTQRFSADLRRKQIPIIQANKCCAFQDLGSMLYSKWYDNTWYQMGIINTLPLPAQTGRQRFAPLCSLALAVRFDRAPSHHCRCCIDRPARLRVTAATAAVGIRAAPQFRIVPLGGAAACIGRTEAPSSGRAEHKQLGLSSQPARSTGRTI